MILKSKQRQIVRERVVLLFRQAEKAFALYPERSHRYVELARRLAMKAKVRLSPLFKRRYCTSCYHYLQPGVNCRVRNAEGHMVYTCFNCKHYMRFPLSLPAKRARRST